MMPLWTTTTSSVVRVRVLSDGLPWVAQRVWPMPAWPASGWRFNRDSRFFSLPSARRRSRWSPSSVATPAGIVTAILKALERIHQLLRDRTAPENADDAAHADEYLQGDVIFENRAIWHLLTRIADVQILNNYCGLKQR